ncbi:acyl-CoA dehydrogenase family protein [Pseudahrensia aquimaris]|uniref:Acyl-CoA dehydrogenase family protein n=1 Tax=Pseudahrensia aquimaris TaxID=744461 RepID=A0ABW3FHV0_9HYPH
MSQTITNIAPLHENYNAYTSDGVLLHLTNAMGQDVHQELMSHGRWVGSAEALDLARMANENPPRLRSLDARGERLDQVEFHPAYHALMRKAVSQGLHYSVWDRSDDEAGQRHLRRAYRFMLTCQLEAGHTCPITMTNASVAIFLADEALARDWLPRISTRTYDSSNKAPGNKRGLTVGMGMTERQGGTDLRQITTRAERAGSGANAGMWRLSGEKWFFSAPMCDAFFVLARTDKGISCFLLPRLLPDGSNNGLRIQRLKNKLGNQSNASSEMLLDNAFATLVGEEGRGIALMLEMVTLSRLDCAVSSAAQMRTALAEAVHHARHRKAFGKPLIDQPLMERVLADMALDVAAAQALTLRLARSFDAAATSDAEGAYARLMTPVVKYWVCKAAPALVVEAMECLGGNGYVEDGIMARLYREAPLNAIWEGSGNVMCLDVLRAMGKSRGSVDAVLETISQGMGATSQQTIDVLRITADMAMADEGSARLFTEQLALTAAAAEMRLSLPPMLADAFVESRLGRPWRHTYGMMDARMDARAIIDFVLPE